MKLDYDCVRDLLLTLEETLRITEDFTWPRVVSYIIKAEPRMEKYSRAQMAYTTQKLLESQYIKAHVSYSDGELIYVIYTSVTYNGHQYLDSIRDPSVWSAVKTELAPIQSVPFKIILTVAESVILSMLKNNRCPDCVKGGQ